MNDLFLEAYEYARKFEGGYTATTPKTQAVKHGKGLREKDIRAGKDGKLSMQKNRATDPCGL